MAFPHTTNHTIPEHIAKKTFIGKWKNGMRMVYSFIRERNPTSRNSDEISKNDHADHPQDRMLFEAALDAIVWSTPEGKFVDCNQHACTLFDYSYAEIQKLSIYDLISGEFESTFSEIIKEQIQTVGVQFEALGKRKNGMLFPVEISTKVIEMAGNVLVVVFVRDITERRRAANELRESEDRFRLLYRATFGGIAIHDKHTIIDANQALETVSGYKFPALIHMDIVKLIAPEFREYVMKAFASGIEKALDVMGIREDGMTYPLEIQTKSIPFHGTSVWATEFRNISERKDTISALQRREAILEAVAYAAKHFLSSRHWEEKIGLIISKIATAAGLSRISIFEKKVEKDGRIKTHLRYEWQTQKMPLGQIEQSGNPADPFPSIMIQEVLIDGKVIHESAKDFSETAAVKCLSNQENSSVVMVPIWVQDTIWGMIGFEDESHDRSWSRGEVDALITAANNLGAAIWREQTVDVLQSSEKRYRELADSLPQTVFETDLQGKSTFCNRHGHDVFGCSPQKAENGTDVFDLVIPEDRRRAKEDFRRIREGKRFVNMEYTAVRHDGSVFPAVVFGSPIVSANQIVGMRGILIDITDRRISEEKIRWNEVLLSQMADSSPIAFYVVDNRSDDILYFNSRFCDIWKIGHLREKMAQGLLKNNDIIPACIPLIRDVDAFANSCKPLQDENDRTICEDEIEFNDGRVIRRFSTQIRDNQDRYYGRFYLFEDITERKLIEKAVIEKENRFRMLFDKSPDPMSIVQNYLFVDCNEAALKMLRCSNKKSVLGISPADISPERQPDGRLSSVKAKEFLDKTTAQGENHFEWLHRRFDGEEFWAEVSLVTITINNDQSIFTAWRDITSRKESEQALQESEKKFRNLFEQSTDMIFITDIDDSFIDVNQAGVLLLGYETKEEMLQIPVSEIYYKKEDQKKFFKVLYREGCVKDFELSLKKKNGMPVFVVISANVIRVKNGQIASYRGIIHDITERKELQQQLTQAQKLEAIGTLAGGIAHDFNNVLSGILGYASLAKTKITKKNVMYNPLEIIERGAQRAAELTAQLIDFSRGGTFTPEVININHVIEETLKIINRTFDKGISVKKKLSLSLPAMHADSGQIQQVLMNLFVNARDAMPDGGQLTVGTQAIEITDSDLNRYANANVGIYVVISVTDTGMGMSKQVLDHIFEPFFTTKDKNKGSGLGLAMTYRITKNHGGFILVDSKEGMGSTFRVYFPASGQQESEQPSILINENLSGNELILVIDDEKDFRQLTQDLLKEYGYRVLLAANGENSVALYQRHWKEIDLVILDLIMPGMGGKETFAELKKINPEVKILLTSGCNLNSRVREIMENGAQGFIQKPYQIKTILKKIRDILGSPKFGRADKHE